MIKAAILNSTLSASVALWVAVITFCFVQPAGFTGSGLSIAPAAIGIPGLLVWSHEDVYGRFTYSRMQPVAKKPLAGIKVTVEKTPRCSVRR